MATLKTIREKHWIAKKFDFGPARKACLDSGQDSVSSYEINSNFLFEKAMK